MKIILISGASTGIGKACALSSAQKGDIVYAGCRKDQDIENLNSLHENIKPIKFDITIEEDIHSVFNLINKEHQKLDCLFNNAGVSATGTAEFQDINTYRSQLEINLNYIRIF